MLMQSETQYKGYFVGNSTPTLLGFLCYFTYGYAPNDQAPWLKARITSIGSFTHTRSGHHCEYMLENAANTKATSGKANESMLRHYPYL